MTNIVMISRNRPQLAKQAVNSIFYNTAPDQFNLTFVDDGSNSGEHWTPWLDTANSLVIRFQRFIGILGFLRNIGAQASEKHFGRGEYICFLDNDIYVHPGWLEKMAGVMETLGPRVAILGGCRHPYHGVNHTIKSVSSTWMGFEETDAVAGYSLFMRWDTWDRFGPFDANAKGVGQSEDYQLCRKVVDAGYKVGYIHPPVLAHCGITDSFGKPAVGADQFERVPGILYL